MNEKDIWATAGFLIKEHGDKAAIVAAQRADSFFEKGDMEGRSLWLRVMRAAAAMIDIPDNAGH